MTAFSKSFLHDVGLEFRSVRQQGTAVALGVVLGLAILVLGAPLVLVGILGVIVLITAFRNPEIVILILLSSVLGLVPARFNPYLRLAGRGFFASDVLVILLMAVLVFRLIADRGFSYLKTPLDAPLLLYLAATIIAMGTAVLNHGMRFSDTTYEARFPMYYLPFLAVTNLVRTKVQLVRLIRGLLFIALLVSATMFMQAGLGRSVLLLDDSVDRGARVIRLFHPGTAAMYLALMTLICDITLRKHHRYDLVRPLQVLGLGVGLSLTLGRNLLVSGVIGLAALALVLRPLQRSRLARSLVLVACVAAGLAGMLVLGGRDSLLLQYSVAFLDRLKRMFSVAILTSEETLVYRWDELRYAWEHIVHNPIFGIGLRTPYRPPFYRGDPLTAHVHNAYIWIWLKTGLLGLVPFLWLWVGFLRRGFRYWRGVQDHFLRAVMLGFTVACLGIAVSNLVAPFFVQDWSVAMFGVILGINEVILMGNEAIDGEGGMRGIQHTAIPS